MFSGDQLKQSILDSAKELVDANVIVGQPIVSGDVTVVPVFKASVGIVTGGSGEVGGYGGGGAGLTVSPVTYIVISGGAVRLLSAGDNSSLERLADAVPGLIERIINAFRPEKPE